MCGRFATTATVDEIGEAFDVTSGLNIPPRYNIAPTQVVSVICHPEEAPILKDKTTRELVYMNWGLVPHWSKKLPSGKPMINARSETVHQKPSFRGPFRHKRCLVPTNGYYEWKTISGLKMPYYVSLKSDEVFAMAGIWDVWTGPGSESWLETMALVTKVASPFLQKVHHRMPVMLGQKDFSMWLGEGQEGEKDIFKKLTPLKDDVFEIQKVSRRINNNSYEGSDLVKPIKEGPILTQGTLF